MGGPASLFAVESFLKEMFNDKAILDIRSSFARKMLASFITHKRLDKSKAIYQMLGGSSPIIAHTYNLVSKLNELDNKRAYTYVMRYSPPMAQGVLEELQKSGINDIILFSMYPQYSTATTASSLLDIQENLKKLNYNPTLRIIKEYPTNRQYNECIAEKIIKTLQGHNASEFVLILSAHSLPQSRIDNGDPYQQQCEANAKILQEILESKQIYFKKIIVSYQSKLGRMKWIGPSTQDTIAKYKKDKILIYPLAFSIDNSETDYEIKILYKDFANSLGVPMFLASDCFNDDTSFAKTIIQLCDEVQNCESNCLSYTN